MSDPFSRAQAVISTFPQNLDLSQAFHLVAQDLAQDLRAMEAAVLADVYGFSEGTTSYDALLEAHEAKVRVISDRVTMAAEHNHPAVALA